MPQLNIPFEPVWFDNSAFDNLINSTNGVLFVHYKATPCPIGMTDVTDSRETHAEHSECTNGFIYELAGEVRGIFRNNSTVLTLGDSGILDGSSVAVTLSRYYDNHPDQDVNAMIYDRFYLKEFNSTVPMTQRVESSITGRDRLQYPAESVELIYGSSSGRFASSDYTVQNGQIVWVSEHRPQFNVELNKGEIISIRYRYRPYFYVNRLLHEIRLFQQTDFLSGEVVTQRAPYEVILSREFYFHKQQRDGSPLQTDEDRLSVGPRMNIFTPR